MRVIEVRGGFAGAVLIDGGRVTIHDNNEIWHGLLKAHISRTAAISPDIVSGEVDIRLNTNEGTLTGRILATDFEAGSLLTFVGTGVPALQQH